MPLCPLDFRYGQEKMKKIFDEEVRLQLMLDVEAAIARAHAKVGNVSSEHAQMITDKANTQFVKLERVWEIEKDTNHDIMAMVKALTEQCGAAGDYVHLGATSNDIVDTVTALQFKKAIEMIMDDLMIFENTLIDLAEEHKNTVMVGRTHGQFAIPLTFGMKIAAYALETHRHLVRLEEARSRICVGKLSGAVGTGAALGEHAKELQIITMESLGLGYEEASLQLVGRDRYVEFIAILSNISASLEKFAVEIRNLQRSEIGEVAEAFDREKQVGSSTMAHKKNPITCENVTGLARVQRAFIIPTLENSPLWHERDLSNSSTERFTIGHSCVLVDDMLVKMNKVFANLAVFPDKMKKNLEMSQGLIMAEALMMALVKKGIGRQDAHEMTRRISMGCIDEGHDMRTGLLADETVSSLFTPEELDALLDPANYTGRAAEIVDDVSVIISG
ncbi:MAG: adenylosuccinate lyase [Thermoplasmata archaeon]|nr:adenylosuccinate lyase [Thermoplasmata archaeon]